MWTIYVDNGPRWLKYEKSDEWRLDQVNVILRLSLQIVIKEKLLVYRANPNTKNTNPVGIYLFYFF